MRFVAGNGQTKWLSIKSCCNLLFVADTVVNNCAMDTLRLLRGDTDDGSQGKLCLGIDLGGTKLAYRLNLGGEEIAADKELTRPDFCMQLKEMYLTLVAKYGLISAVAVGVPGPVRDNVMGPSFPLQRNESTFFNAVFPGVAKLAVRNDLFMALLAELNHGYGREFQNLVLVSISTGIGVAVAINGKPLEIRIEMGHQRNLLPVSDHQTCINHSNCWASLCSGLVMQERLDEFNLCNIRCINRQAFCNLVAAYDPDVIVVMGGVGLGLFDWVIPLSEEIAGELLTSPPPKIHRTTLGENIGVLGACWMAEELLRRKGPTLSTTAS